MYAVVEVIAVPTVPLTGWVAGVMLAALMLNVTVAVACLVPFEPVIVTVLEFEAVGVPVMTPEVESIDKPVGRVPLVTL